MVALRSKTHLLVKLMAALRHTTCPGAVAKQSASRCAAANCCCRVARMALVSVPSHTSTLSLTATGVDSSTASPSTAHMAATCDWSALKRTYKSHGGSQCGCQ
jgi:hypothetical protein